MGKIGSEHKRIRTDSFDGIRQRFLITLATDKNPTASKIVLRFSLEPEATVLQLSFQAVDNQGYPGSAAL